MGALIASRYGASTNSGAVMLKNALTNPTIAAFGLALLYRDPLPGWLDSGLTAIAWSAIGLALLLIVPLLMWVISHHLPIPTIAKPVIVLQSAMPPAFATVVLTENYNLDPEFAVAVVAGGTIGLLFTLPLWLWLLGG